MENFTDQEYLDMGYSKGQIQEFHIVDFWIKQKSTKTGLKVVFEMAKLRYRFDNWYQGITRGILINNTRTSRIVIYRALLRLERENVIEIQKREKGVDTISFTKEFIRKANQ